MNKALGNIRKTTMAIICACAMMLCLPALAWAEDASLSLQAGEISANDSALTTQTLKLDGSGTTTYAGDTMYETAVAQAKAAYPKGASIAIIAGPGEAWVDALSAAGLAGAVDGPILFSKAKSMHPASLQALEDLGVKEVIIVGGTAAVGKGVESDLKKAGISVKARLWGKDCYGTNLAIFEYGEKEGIWGSELAIVATGTWFGDALSISPVAFAKKAPIFLADKTLTLNKNLKTAWERGARAGLGKTTVAVGGPAVVSEATVDFAGQMSKLAGGSGKAEWLWGQEQYETSGKIADWAVKSQGFHWNNAAFTTGKLPYDALAGSVLQGKEKSVLLLADSNTSATISTAAEKKKSISHVRFFGGDQAVPTLVRTAVTAALSNRVKTESAGLSYARMLSLELSSVSWYTASEVTASMDPANFGFGDPEFYQFAVLNNGYSGKVTAKQLNEFINTYGSDGTLAGHGQDFIDAAKKYNINEVYLLSHAILETGWGKSKLARGTVIDGVTYYNFFGIGAYDSDPEGGGGRTAGQYGWDSPRAAILGSAKWISSNYHNNAYNQNTLYKMKWNYHQAARESTVWHQYATGIIWPSTCANVMARCYAYCGLDMESSGLVFVVPQYS